MAVLLKDKIVLKDMHNILLRLDNVDAPRGLFFVLLALLVLILFPTTWSGNEENYFQLAFRRVAPEEFSPFHAVFDQSNGRFLAESLLGWLIQAVGYESAFFFARIVMAILYAIGLTVFFRALGLSALMAAGVITVFYLSGQQLFGGEWLFIGVESKTFAYAAVFASLGYGFSGRWIPATILIATATYFHFLVGGFWCLALALIAFFHTNNVSASIRIIFYFSLLILPLVIIIAIDQFGGQPINSILQPAEIYALRAPHHVAPFISLGQFKNWVLGIISAGLLIVFFLFSRQYVKDKKLINISLLLLAYLFMALAISLVDRNTHYFGKFYLFRPSSLILLLSICTIFLLLGKQATNESRAIYRIGVSAVVLFLGVKLMLSIANYYISDETPVITSNLVDVIKENSNTNEIVLLDPSKIIYIERYILRPTLVAWKFVPTHPHDLIRWYNLMQYRKELFENGCSKRFDYPVKLLLVSNDTSLDSVKSCGDVIWSSSDMSLVRISEQWDKIN